MRYLNIDNFSLSHLFPLDILETPLSTVEEAFQEFTKRKDVAIILINQHVRREARLFFSFCAIQIDLN